MRWEGTEQAVWQVNTRLFVKYLLELWRVIVFPLSLSLTLLRMNVTLCKQILVLL